MPKDEKARVTLESLTETGVQRLSEVFSRLKGSKLIVSDLGTRTFTIDSARADFAFVRGPIYNISPGPGNQIFTGPGKTIGEKEGLALHPYGTTLIYYIHIPIIPIKQKS